MTQLDRAVRNRPWFLCEQRAFVTPRPAKPLEVEGLEGKP
jgi:hypothetical protein